ncbi:hypothetical protein V8C86DRAFT_2593386 [Haematococcus lacustris]
MQAVKDRWLQLQLDLAPTPGRAGWLIMHPDQRQIGDQCCQLVQATCRPRKTVTISLSKIVLWAPSELGIYPALLSQLRLGLRALGTGLFSGGPHVVGRYESLWLTSLLNAVVKRHPEAEAGLVQQTLALGSVTSLATNLNNGSAKRAIRVCCPDCLSRVRDGSEKGSAKSNVIREDSWADQDAVLPKLDRYVQAGNLCVKQAQWTMQAWLHRMFAVEHGTSKHPPASKVDVSASC